MVSCCKCGEEIKDQILTAEEKKWHVKCFVCEMCSKPFMEGGAMAYVKLKDGKCVCEACKAKHDGVDEGEHLVCAGCGKDVSGETLNFEGKTWHKQCFTCEFCQQPILKEGTTEIALTKKDGKRACLDCGHAGAPPQKKGECAACGEPLGVDRVVAEEKSFHTYCFKCEDCKRHLHDPGQKELSYAKGSDGQRYCVDCQTKHKMPGGAANPVHKCGKCGDEFPGTQEALKDAGGNVLCSKCSPAGNADCAKCGKTLTLEDFREGAKISGDKHYHSECWDKISAKWTHKDLKDESKWKAAGIRSSQREQFLASGEFQQLFGMTKEDFDKLPKFKQDEKKKAVDLF